MRRCANPAWGSNVTGAPDHLLAGEQVTTASGTAVVGREIRHSASTGSTNDDLRRYAQAGAAEGLVLSTDEQTQGRGRRGRVWLAPPASSILASTLLRPAWLPPSEAFYLTMLAGVAVAEAVEEVVAPLVVTNTTTVTAKAGTLVGLKWPNDLQAGGLKFGGILAETELAGEEIRWAIIGIGLNVNWSPASVPELAAIATSLSNIAGGPVPRPELFAALLRRVDSWYVRLRMGARSDLFETWRSRLSMLGREVRAEVAGQMIEGVAEDVTAAGALVVRDSTGQRHELSAGEVTVRNR